MIPEVSRPLTAYHYKQGEYVMPIAYHEASGEFHLYNSGVSYIIHLLPNAHAGQVYFGERLRDRASFAHLLENAARPISSWPLRDRVNFSLEFARQEYPCFGTSDYRQPAFELSQENGSAISDFAYTGYRISAGKPELSGLPHAYVEDEREADTLELFFRDRLTGAELTLSYTIFADYDVIARSARFANRGTETLYLKRALSMSVDFPDRDFQWMQFSGAWGRECQPVVRQLQYGVTAIESMRGHSSAHENPFVILKRPHTDENQGECYGFTFVYSGNFLAQAEVDTYDAMRFSMGINPRNFTWKLAPGDEFQTPEVLMTYGGDGLNGLSGTIHRLLRRRVARGYWRDRPRPILINNWEATGMQFTEARLLEIARTAADVGIELFVLDDGWFGRRTEFSGLGDWYDDKSKLPEGLKGLSEKINALGMKFGVWIEPEMVNEDSDLYRAHPEYVLAAPGRSKSFGRCQLVLDFSNPEVVDYIYNLLMKAFDGVQLSYIKWDMNRSITECYSPHWPADRQGEIYHRYILGVYRLYEKLRTAFPEVLFESCASGGSRYDAGMLYYAPQAWRSDDTDAAERLRIQYGSSYGYPVSSCGAHVSTCPNQQTGRTAPLSTRANVAFFGAFGYEMDLNELGPDERNEVRTQIAFMKEHRELLQYGDFYRLANPYEGRYGAWMSVSADKTSAIVGFYKLLNTVNTGFYQLKLQGLNPEWDYEINGKTVMGGDELMKFGLLPKDPAGHVTEMQVCEAIERMRRDGVEFDVDGDGAAAEMARSYGEMADSLEWRTLCDFDSRLFLLKAVRTDGKA